nr:RHS repeat-associated core domain-containing protein [Planctomycetota bacterium]
GYDANKRKTSETDALRPDLSQVFGYDDEDRLTSWTRTGPGTPPSLTQTWDLSLVGDWDQTTVDGVPESRGHNAVHEATTVGAANLSYDAKGNLTVDERGQGLSWDVENRLAAAVNLAEDDDSASYVYDALGRRVAKGVVKDGVTSTRVFVCSGPRVLSEYVDGVLDRSYVYGGYVDDVVGMIDHAHSDARFYFHANHLYSVAALTKGDGSVVERYGYDAYGASVVTDASALNVIAGSTVGQPYRFTGRRLDGETGLSYFRARYFDHGLGRFIGRDPLQRSYSLRRGALEAMGKSSEALWLGPHPMAGDGYQDGYSLYQAYFVPLATDPTGMYTIDIDCCCYIDQAISNMQEVVNLINNSIADEISSFTEYRDRRRQIGAVNAGTAFFGARSLFGQPACVTQAIDRVERDGLIATGRAVTTIIGGGFSLLFGTVTNLSGEEGAKDFMTVHLSQELVAHRAVLNELNVIKQQCDQKQWCCDGVPPDGQIGPPLPDGSF